MHALATRPGRLALGIAVLTAAALGTVSASAAQASGTKTAEAPATATSVVHTKAGHGEAGHGKAGHGKAGNTIAGYGTAGHRKPPKGAGFGVAYRPTADAPDDVNAANDAFAACMRGHGQSVFPDIHASKDAKGHIRLQVKIRGAFDPTSKGYKKAMKACGPIMNKAGITFPSGPGMPSLPGKPGEGAPSLHTEKGTSDTSGTSDLVTSAA